LSYPPHQEVVAQPPGLFFFTLGFRSRTSYQAFLIDFCDSANKIGKWLPEQDYEYPREYEYEVLPSNRINELFHIVLWLLIIGYQANLPDKLILPGNPGSFDLMLQKQVCCQDNLPLAVKSDKAACLY
jgi:hypothetical protein